MKKKTFISICMFNCALFLCFMAGIFLMKTETNQAYALSQEALVISDEVNMDNTSSGEVELLSDSKKSDNAVLIEGTNYNNFTKERSRNELTNVKYIPNANYFLINPKHFDSTQSGEKNGTCTTIAVQMLLGYHNYYSDRRIIPTTANGETFLNGDYGNIEYDPSFDRNMEPDQGCVRIGTKDGLYQELIKENDALLLQQAIWSVTDAGNDFIKKHSDSEAKKGISLTNSSFSASTARSDIDAGRPIVLGMDLWFDKNFHVVVAYGYAKLDGENGFLVHYGWGDVGTLVWVPDNFFGYQIRMRVNHTHTLVDTGEDVKGFARKLECSECGYKKVDLLYNTENSTITKIRYPASNIVTIPSEIDIYSKDTASFTHQSITAIAANVFANQEQITNVSISSTVSSIGDNAFMECENLKYVSSYGGLASIGDYAFSGCTNLTSVSLPNSLTSIGEYAFFDCGLTSVTIPRNVTTIGECAFSWCSKLENIQFRAVNCEDSSEDSLIFLSAGGETEGVNLTIGNGVTYIPAYLFSDFSVLKTVTISQSVTGVGEYAFYHCGLTSLTLPASLQEVGASAFDENTGLSITWNYNGTNGLTAENFAPYLKAVNLADGTQELKANAFKNATNLTSVSLPSTLTSVGDYAFYNCNLTSLTLPVSLQEVGICAFDENTGLSISWNYDGTSSLTAENFVTYLTTVNIVDGTQEIKASAFKNATKVTSVTLPDTLTTIGYSAFMNCSLTSVTIPSSVEVVGTDAFYGNTGLSITWNYGGTNGLTAETFGGYLTSVVFEPSATTIQREAFRRATGLTSLTIPNTVTSIDRFAFFGCRNLTSLHISASVTEIGIGLTRACDNLVTLTVDEANPVYRSEGNCVIRRADNALVAGCMGSVIPSSVLSIEGYAFGDLDELTSIEIGSSVEHIGQRAFTGTGLTSIRLPASMESLAQQAFEECLSLETVYIDGYEVIDLEYVDGNGDFVSYTYPNSVFLYCDELQSIYVPDAATAAAYRADEYWSFFADLIFVENTSGPIGGGGSGIGGGSETGDEESGGENEGGDEEITEEIGGVDMVVLITDASATDSRVVWLKNYYQCNRVHPNRGSYTAAEIGALIGEYETSHFVFYAKTGLFFNRLMYETSFGTYFNNLNLLSAMVVTDNGVYKLYDETATVVRDTYSMGFKIAKEFVYEDSGDWVSEMGEALGYVPITAPAWYKSDLRFLMGLSDVFGYPVKIVTADVVYDEETGEETSELQAELRLLSEYGLNPQTWLFVDVETTEWISAFDEFGTEYGAFYFFNRNESVLPSLQTLSTHVYLISDKARIPEDVLTVVIEGVDEETAYTWVFQAWEAWGEFGLDADESIWKREEYIRFWTNMGYSLATTDWESYESFNLNGSWDWYYYQEVMGNTVYVEQNVTSYPITEE